MYYTIYKVTNTINGKYYIGKHQTENLNDGYMGSGRVIKQAIKKYGIDNFQKEILFVFNDEPSMNAKEKELVTLNEMSYNLCPGGKGGFGYINETVWYDEKRLEHNRKHSPFKNFTKEQRLEYTKMGGIARGKWLKTLSKEERSEICGTFRGKQHTKKAKEKIGKANSGKVPWNKGKPRTEEEKRKIREGLERRRQKKKGAVIG